MLVDALLAASLALNVLILLLLIGGRLAARTAGMIRSGLDESRERLERAIRSEWEGARREAAEHAALNRRELSTAFAQLGDELRKSQGEWARAEAEQSESRLNWLATLLKEAGEAGRARLEGFQTLTEALLTGHRDQVQDALAAQATQQQRLLDTFARELVTLTEINQTRLGEVRDTLDRRLNALEHANQAKLEEMRATVDEKLNQTLERRLGESFQRVSERLEQVQRGLGEMQTLAAGVGDLKRVLTNVKTRGTLGEIRLEALLDEILDPGHYEKNLAVRPQSGDRVDFAVRLPGHDEQNPVWLPLDAKFPLEDYEALLAAEENGNAQKAGEAAKRLEVRIRDEARSIAEKYVDPPHTTDFAILFLPVEGLFAEVLRRPGLWEQIRREHRVVVTGPTTVTALLNSLQLGFRTLAIERRSSEVWKLLGTVKTEFARFGEVLDRTKKRLAQATDSLDRAQVRTRAIERQLRDVEALPVDGDGRWELDGTDDP